MSAERIRELLGLMRDNDVVELELEVPDFKIKLRKPGAIAPALTATPAFYPATPPLALPMPVAGRDAGTVAATQFLPADVLANAGNAAAPAAAANLTPIKSPIVGTFYCSSSPEAEPFVAVGTRVTKDTVVCIIEAMKIMNEIKAGVSGVIDQIPLENGEPVEYGQPLFFVRPS